MDTKGPNSSSLTTTLQLAVRSSSKFPTLVTGSSTRLETRSLTCLTESADPLMTTQGDNLEGNGKTLSRGQTRALPEGREQGLRPGVGPLFPARLHVMLNCAESKMFDHIVSWQPHGRCFKVHQPLRFVTEVMPIWFHHTKFASFRRQLNLYGFSRVTTGADRRGYYHKNFLRGDFEASERMVRTHVTGTCVRVSASRLKQPNFYETTPCNDLCRTDSLKKSTYLEGMPPSSFNDTAANNAMNPAFFDVIDHSSDERTRGRSDETMSSTSSSSGGLLTLYQSSLPSSLSCVKASPVDIGWLNESSRCLSPLFESNELCKDETTFVCRFHLT